MSAPSELANAAGDMSILSAAVVLAVILTVAATVYAAVSYLRGLVEPGARRPPPSDSRAVWAAARRAEGQSAGGQSAGSGWPPAGGPPADYPRGDYAPAR
jgi:hypothetical protein